MPGYGATNTRDDPAYWEAQLTHVNPNIRGQAQLNLARIQNQQRQAQQNAQYQQSLGVRQREFGQHAADTRAQQHEAEAGRNERAKASQDIQRESMIDRRINALQSAAEHETDPAKATALRNQWYQLAGVNIPQTGAQPAVDPAIQRTAQKAGYTPVQQPQPQAPNPNASGRFSPGIGLTGGGQGGGGAPPAQATGYHWYHGTGGVSGGNDAGQRVSYDDGTSRWESTSIPGQSPFTTPGGGGSGQGGHDFAANTPAGYDYNLGTGQYVPKSNPNFRIPEDSIPALDPHGNPRADAFKTINPDGTTTTHFAAGGTSTGFESNTPEGVGAINKARYQGAARGQYLEAHPEAYSNLSGGSMQVGAGRAEIPSNLPRAPKGSWSPVQLHEPPGLHAPTMEAQTVTPSDQPSGEPSSNVGAPQTAQTGGRSPVAPIPEQIPTDATGDRQWPSGGASSGMHSGAWLADQFKDIPISINTSGHVGEENQIRQQQGQATGGPQPPQNVLPQMTAEQTAAIEAQRRAEEEARRAAAAQGR